MQTLTIDFEDERTGRKRRLPLKVLKKPKNDREYARFEKVLDSLIDCVRDNEAHPLTTVMEIIAENLEQYDNEHNPPIGDDLTDIEIVQYLMKENHLHQKDLAEIFGGQANVSKFLNGEWTLNKNQIAGLKKKFGISADLFF